jgi:hypothetical protein
MNEQPVVACIDSGGILRCRTGSNLLNTLGIPARPYAAHDTSRQTYQGVVSAHIAAVFQGWLGTSVVGEPIQRIPEDIVNNVRYLLVYCGLDELPSYIQHNDPRLCHKYVPDVKAICDLQDYRRAMVAVSWATISFIQDNFPDFLT